MSDVICTNLENYTPIKNTHRLKEDNPNLPEEITLTDDRNTLIIPIGTRGIVLSDALQKELGIDYPLGESDVRKLIDWLEEFYEPIP